MKRRIAIIAFACSPYRGSECAVGWGYLISIARKSHVTVVINSKFRDDCEKWFSSSTGKELTNEVCRVYLDFEPAIGLPLGLRQLSYYSAYRKWHRRAFKLLKFKHEISPFALVHQLTMVGYREPGWLYELPVPFVWGPIGGVNVFPLQLTKGMPFIQRASMMTYNIVNWLTIRLSPRVRIAAQRAGNQLIFATSETRDKITKTLKLQSTKVLSEVGIADEQVLAPKSLTPGTVQLLWVGQLLHGKALHLALEAVSRIGEDTNWHLTILGEGPEHARMVEYVNDLGIREKVSLKGKVTRQEVFNCMRLADLLLITSLKELTSTVTLEAIACGTPVIAPDHCGFRDVLSEGVGVLIPICPRDQFVKLYSRAIEDLVTNQFEYELLSVRSIERAHKYKWSYKEQEINKIYEEALR